MPCQNQWLTQYTRTIQMLPTVFEYFYISYEKDSFYKICENIIVIMVFKFSKHSCFVSFDDKDCVQNIHLYRVCVVCFIEISVKFTFICFSMIQDIRISIHRKSMLKNFVSFNKLSCPQNDYIISQKQFYLIRISCMMSE